MATSKDYDRAAEIMREKRSEVFARLPDKALNALEDAFVQLFEGNPKFDAARFRAACKPKAGG
jgi:hypothetical protein